MAAIACGVAATIIVFFVEHLSFVGINLLGAAWGAFAFPLYAISVAHANDYAEIDDYVMISRGLLLLYGAGAIIGPFMASALMTSVGGAGLFLFSASAHFVLILYVIHRLRRRRTVDPQSQIAFSDALATAHTASQVYEEEIQYVAEHGDRE